MPSAGVALVTGGSKGIGKSVCSRLASAGYAVALGSRDRSEGEKVASELREAGARALFVQTDVASSEPSPENDAVCKLY